MKNLYKYFGVFLLAVSLIAPSFSTTFAEEVTEEVAPVAQEVVEEEEPAPAPVEQNPVSEYDFCHNIKGIQRTLPSHLRRAEGSFFCTEIPKVQNTPAQEYDFCDNIEGTQATLPDGYKRAEGSFECVKITPVQVQEYDFCSNIPDTQSTLPDGMYRLEGSFECERLPLPPAQEYDFCDNMDGTQATLPDGYKRAEGSFECVKITPAPVQQDVVNEYDFCANIDGIQKELPAGLRRAEGSFECTEIPKVRSSGGSSSSILQTPSAQEYDFCSNLGGIQSKLPDGFKRAEGSFICKLINEGSTRISGPSEDDVQSNSNNTPVSNTVAVDSFEFTKDLFRGISDPEVLELQKFLNKNGYIVSTDGAGSIGNETDFFGPKTQAAVISFQKANGIKPALGYFGPITRTVVNSLLN